MKTLIVICLAAVAFAKPKGLPKVGFNQNRIIGGHEAEPRKSLLLLDVLAVTTLQHKIRSFPHKLLYNFGRLP